MMDGIALTENKITKDKSCEKVPHLEITEIILFHSNLSSNNYK